jgi:hypothetical protein
MRKSNRESIRRTPLSKTLSSFHLRCIWSQPRASALRDNLCFSLPSAHAVFYCVGEIIFFVARRTLRRERRCVRVGQEFL